MGRCRSSTTQNRGLTCQRPKGAVQLIADRVWRTRSQLELAIVEWVAWFNNDRLHESLGDCPPAEVETLNAEQYVLTPSPKQ
jgi:transposase InsO family protein